MEHYRNPTSGEVFAYESEAEREEFGAAELVAMTDEEVAQHLNPPAPVPQEVTMQKARRALRAAGKLAAVEAAIDALPEPARSDARDQWEYSATVQRHNPLVLNLAQQLGLDLDALFAQAAQLP